MRALVVCAHGTDNPRGQDVVRSIVAQVARARPDLVVREAYVDVQQPSLPDVVDALVPQVDSVVIVPLLLSSGFHTEVDVATAAASSPYVSAAPALGPHELLAEVLADRLRAAGADQDDAVVLAVAGSSREAGAADAEAMRAELATTRSGPVSLGFLAARDPTVPDAVADARRAGGGDRRRVVIASYLIGPGIFHDRLAAAGADAVAEPIGDDPKVAELVLARFEAADPVHSG